MIHAGESAGLYINSGGTRVIVRMCSTLIVEVRSAVVFGILVDVRLQPF